MSYIKAERLTKQYGDGDAAVMAIQDIDFEVESGEFVSILTRQLNSRTMLHKRFLDA